MNLKEKQIIYVDNKPHIKCNVVMLSTNNKSDLRLIRGYDGNVLGYNPLMSSAQLHNNKDSTISYHHLYITSDEEIKESDWFLADIRNHISENNGNPIWELKQCTHIDNSWIFTKEVGIGFNPNWCKKIIATTDELYLSELFPVDNEIHSLTSRLPQPSQQFIEKYIEEYNKGNIISEGLVEVEVDLENYNNWEPPFPYKSLDEQVFYKLKLDSQNTITIRKIKDSWNREEVIDLCRSAYLYGEQGALKLHNGVFKEWIEENL